MAWKGSLYFQEDPAPDEPRALKDSVVAFTKNGKLQGIAYRQATIHWLRLPLIPVLNSTRQPDSDGWLICRDILEGTYYPAISIYTLPSQSEGATVSVKFGMRLSDTRAEQAHRALDSTRA